MVAMVDEFSVCTLKSALPNDPPGYFLGRVFSLPYMRLIGRIKKLDASYLMLKVDSFISDVVITLRTRTI